MVFSEDENGSIRKQGRLHRCQFCQYTSCYTTNLKKHVLTHTGERPFACSYCNYRSSQKTNLKKHLVKHQQI